MARKHEHDRRRDDYELSAVKSPAHPPWHPVSLSLPQLITLAIGILSIVAALTPVVVSSSPTPHRSGCLQPCSHGCQLGPETHQWVPVGFR